MSRGRPQTPEEVQEKKQKFLQVYTLNGGLRFRTCKEIGMEYRELMDWLRTDKEFKEDFERVHEEHAEVVESVILKLARGEKTQTSEKPNLLAGIFYLNNKGQKLGYGLGNQLPAQEPQPLWFQQVDHNKQLKSSEDDPDIIEGVTENR